MLREKTLAVLGAGLMGGALMRGLVASGAMPASGIRLFDTDRPKAEAVAAELGPVRAPCPLPRLPSPMPI